MAISEQQLLFWLLVLFMAGCFGGWLLKVAVDQYKADQRREEEAEERRREYEQRYIEQCERRIKTENRNQLIYLWLSEVKGGVKK